MVVRESCRHQTHSKCGKHSKEQNPPWYFDLIFLISLAKGFGQIRFFVRNHPPMKSGGEIGGGEGTPPGMANDSDTDDTGYHTHVYGIA
eukprot:scaffold2257_cov169-Amphora_coffeaeformis.AAC.12